MKNNALLTAFIIGLVGIGSAYAQPPQDSQEHSGKMFDTLDTNSDGSLSADELKQMRSAMARLRFQEADSNGDGRIDHDEFTAQSEKRAEHMFTRMDRNGDGSLSADEAKPRHHGRHGKAKGEHKRHGGFMKRMDTDRNGTVSRDEWDTAMQKMHDRNDRNDAG